MRAQREQREAPIIAPYKADMQALVDEINIGRREISGLRRTIATFERMFAGKLVDSIVGKIGYDMALLVRKTLAEALQKAHKAMGDPEVSGLVDIQIAADDLRWMDEDSLQNRILEEWKGRSLRGLRLTAGPSAFTDAAETETAATVLRIQIPAIGYNYAMWDEAPRMRGGGARR
jgi:hypothetical protein